MSCHRRIVKVKSREALIQFRTNRRPAPRQYEEYQIRVRSFVTSHFLRYDSCFVTIKSERLKKELRLCSTSGVTERCFLCYNASTKV